LSSPVEGKRDRSLRLIQGYSRKRRKRFLIQEGEIKEKDFVAVKYMGKMFTLLKEERSILERYREGSC